MQGTTPILKRSTCQALGIIHPEFPKQVYSQVCASVVTPPIATKESLMEEFSDVFSGVVTSMKGESFKIHLEPNATAFSVSSPRRIPLPLMDRLKDELQELQKQGIIRPVTEPTQWCAPIVIAPKKDPAQIRLCVDFRHLNKHICRERYQSPTPYEAVMRSGIREADLFTVVDALKGYHRIPIAREDQLLTTFITPFGRFCYMKSPFGISSISEHYNRRVDEAIAGLQHTTHVVDDCLVFSKGSRQHENDVRCFLQRCREQSIALNPKKFFYAQKQVTFAGMHLSSSGCAIDAKLLEAIKEFPVPADLTDLRSFFGLINQLSSFTDKISELAKPLQSLLKKTTQFV
jgi:hypothetical protein